MNIEKTVGWKALIFKDQGSDCRQSSFLRGSFSCVMTAKIMYLQAYKK